jgi:hypothetical protein
MNQTTTWQYRALSVEQEAQRDVLIRLWMRLVRALMDRRLVKCLNVSLEQREVQRVPTRHPGIFRYPEKRTLLPDPDWGWDHPLGQWTVEATIRVDEEDRGESCELGDVATVEGQMLWELFETEICAADPRPVRQMHQAAARVKAKKRAPSKPKRPARQAKPPVPKPPTVLLRQQDLWGLFGA